MRFRQILVAVPARNEAETIQACIESIDAASRWVDVPVTLVVAADSCSDTTAATARAVEVARCDLVVIEGRWGRAGAARAAAVETGSALHRGANGCWIANTDADCVVPASWLATQIDLAGGVAAIGGVVHLDPDTTDPDLLDAFDASYQLDGDRHPHVHGANIGLSGDAYRTVGGWCPRTEVGEDHLLWDRLVARGHLVRQTTSLSVVTSARVRSRVVGGFATNLGHLDRPARSAAAHA